MSESLNDLSLMPFGQHKGKPMQDVPASYLVWLKEQGCNHEGVRGYITENWSAIKSELPDRIWDEGDKKVGNSAADDFK
jgi:uncharacterized protein (DUF3820 family)